VPASRDRSRTRPKGRRAPLPSFELQGLIDGSAHTLVLSGELDMLASPELQGAISALCRGGATRLVLDLSELTFMDLMGLRTITFAKELCEWHRCELGIVPGPESVQRVFALTDLLDAMPFEPAAAAESRSRSHG
jgi:anti-anti-sigma factor